MRDLGVELGFVQTFVNGGRGRMHLKQVVTLCDKRQKYDVHGGWVVARDGTSGTKDFEMRQVSNKRVSPIPQVQVQVHGTSRVMAKVNKVISTPSIQSLRCESDIEGERDFK